MNVELILKNISRFISLAKEEVELFISFLQAKHYKRKEFILRPGEICKHEIFVNKGCLKNYTIDNNGVEHIGMFAFEDWWTGDMHSFITQTPATSFIEALEDTEVMLISKKDLETMYESVPKFERFFRILFQNSLVTHIQRINQNIAYTAEERYLNFIEKYPNLEQRIRQKQMAAYLGITPEFLSVLRKKMTKK